MARRHRAKSKKAGLPPGTLVYTGQKRVEVPDLTALTYTPTSIHTAKSISDIQYPVKEGVLWIDIRGLHETDLLRKLGGQFGIHALALEDIVDIYQRPKYDSYEEGFLILLESFTFLPEEIRITQEQISIFCGKDFVLSFQEDAKDCFESIRERIKSSQGRIRKYHSDYLTYALVDNIVDHYFVSLESIGDVIENLESEIAASPSFETKNRVHLMKRIILDMRKGITPLREAVSLLMRSDTNFISDATRPYLQDLYGNVLQAIEMTETYRDILSGLQDLYLAEISYKMNKVIQTLTIVSTIFIPLTFLAGVYGMNFDNMPELHWKYGYFILLGFMALVSILLLLLFHKRKWL
ncbi:MAG TPA: magnesium/cobalt transporter CorA [Saprospiraceae bacterium]|nr:magnesium/cobalt transporter CorA [Saprospiraceae bacterium]